MSINYKVTITPAKKPNEFHIIWYNLVDNTEDGFDVSAEGITREEVEEKSNLGLNFHGFDVK